MFHDAKGSDTMRAGMRLLRWETKQPSVEWQKQKLAHTCDIYSVIHTHRKLKTE